MQGCIVLTFLPLPGGSCAEWFSGFASSLAVIVALGGYFLSEHRRRKDSKDNDIRNLVTAIQTVENIISESDATLFIITENYESGVYKGKTFATINRMSGVEPVTLTGLNEHQIFTIYKGKNMKFHLLVINAIRNINALGLFIDNYNKELIQFENSGLMKRVKKDQNVEFFEVIEETEEQWRFFKILFQNRSKHIVQRSFDNFHQSLLVLKEFSNIVNGKDFIDFQPLLLDVDDALRRAVKGATKVKEVGRKAGILYDFPWLTIIEKAEK